MSNWVVRTILDAANNRNKNLIRQMTGGVLDANKARGRLIDLPMERSVNGVRPVYDTELKDVGRVAAQLGYGKAMDGARYAGQIIKDNPVPVALGGLGVGLGLYSAGLTPDPFGQRERVANAFNQARESYMWPYDPTEPAPNGQPYARELSDEEILEMQRMGML